MNPFFSSFVYYVSGWGLYTRVHVRGFHTNVYVSVRMYTRPSHVCDVCHICVPVLVCTCALVHEGTVCTYVVTCRDEYRPPPSRPRTLSKKETR